MKAFADQNSPRASAVPSKDRWLVAPRSRGSINAREKLWALKLRRVNFKPVLHPPVETARLSGTTQDHLGIGGHPFSICEIDGRETRGLLRKCIAIRFLTGI
jgi:hypothetical protein